MQTQLYTATYLQKTARIILKIILFLFLFIVLLLLLVFTPPAQKFLTGRVENYLEKKLQTKVEIGSISIGLPRKVSLQNIYIEDRTKDTLVYGGSIKANVELLKLFSNEVRVKDIQFDNITAKIKRVLPDTAFNFQFIVDAFAVEQTKKTDTAQTAVLKLDVDQLDINSSRIIYKDVITGNDMTFAIGALNAHIDTLNPYQPNYAIQSLDIKNTTAFIRQSKPLVEPEPLSKDIAEAAAPTAMKLFFDKVNLQNINVDYGNDASALYTVFNIDKLALDGKQIDMQNRLIYFDELKIDNTNSAIRLGKKQAAKVLTNEIKKEVAVQSDQGWVIKADRVELNNVDFAFDNDNNPKQPYGIDYAHMKADDLNLHAQNFVLSTDSIGGLITKGSFKEKSGFVLNELEGDILYAHNQTYLKDLYLKTPGTELKRSAILEYESLEALTNNFPATVINLDIEESHVQVKDILAFAPQLRSQPAFKRVNDIWYLNVKGSGTFNDRLHFETLQFRGLQNTQLDASGTLAGITNPNEAGGTFTIRKLHTTQNDMALFTGTRLSTPDINLPETFDINGTLSGNAANLATNLNIHSSAGFVAVNGRFTNLTNVNKATYNAQVKANGLRLGSILKNPQLGNVTANMHIAGSGFTPASINTKFNGRIDAIGLNNYTYRNIDASGTLRKTIFDIDAKIKDPNAYLTASVNGNFSQSPSFHINAYVDSLKTLPLHFTTQPVVFRGQINGDIANFDPDYLKANVLVTNAIIVSGNIRQPLDTLQLVADKNGNDQYIRLTSDIATAAIEGQFRFTELASIFQNNIQPYFNIVPKGTIVRVHPYSFSFNADISNSPIISSFVPGVNIAEPLHIDGTLATNRGIDGSISSQHITFQNNDIQNLDVKVTTTASGLQIAGTMGQLKNGNAYHIYNTRFNATALNNNINFNLGIDDKNGRNKYILNGLLTQPKQGTYALQLGQDSLMLNYQPWTVSTGNQLILSPTAITANNFVLKNGNQQLALQSIGGASPSPLNVSFTNFQLSTITGFLRADSLLADGAMNGTVTFKNLMENPLFTSDLTINDFSMKQDTIGNLRLMVNNTSLTKYNADITLSGRGNDARITGTLEQQNGDVLLDLNAHLQQLQLNSLIGASGGFLRKADGSVNGNIKIGGTLAAPDLAGNVNFNQAVINTSIFGGDFFIDNEKLNVTNNGFVFDDFTIKDSASNVLTLNGNIITPNFINYTFNLDVDADHFKILNTTKKDNKIYYGDLVITTSLHVAGTETSPIVDGNLAVNDGTNLSVVIPQAEPGIVDREGVVQFVDFNAPGNDTLFRAYDSLNVSSLLGFDVSANIDIQKEALLNIIVDVANGDFINMQGTGQLSAGIDPSGKITLTGPYEIEKGAYQLSFNFIKRKFEIEKGSKIVWMGDPTSAQLDVKAVYIANTAPLDLVENQIETAQRNYYLQKLPFQVILKLDGELMRPNINFDVLLPQDKNYNVVADVITNVNNRLSQLRQEPSELNKQVFAVLLLNRFVGENPFQSSAGGFNAGSFARQSVSKLLTDQLNNLAGGLINGVDINFDVASADDYTTGSRRSRTDLNVGLSKRLLNDRLTVTVGSNFMLEGPQQVNQPSNNVAGNVAINYQLSKDGRYMLRFYRKNEYEGTVDGYLIETGLGFIITVDYDHFKEILRGRKKIVKKEVEKQNQQQ